MLRRLLLVGILLTFLYNTASGRAWVQTLGGTWQLAERSLARGLVAMLVTLDEEAIFVPEAERLLSLLLESRDEEEKEVIRRYLELR